MRSLEKLLALDNSLIASFVKIYLAGFGTSLSELLTNHPNDPAIKLCQELKQELDDLLNPDNITTINETPTVIQTQTPNSLDSLWTEFSQDPNLSNYLVKFDITGKTEAEKWINLQLKILRLPEDQAQIWQNKISEKIAQLGFKLNTQSLDTIPSDNNTIIYPGLSNGINIPGLEFSIDTPTDPRLNSNNDIAKLVSSILHLIKIEPNLHHALEGVNRFDVVSFSDQPEQKEQYIDTLLDRFHRVQKAEEEGNHINILRRWIELDEAINSLVFIPPVDRFSWWGRLQQESRKFLKRVSDHTTELGYHQIRIRPLVGLYADLYKFSHNDLQLEHGGNKGDVLTCLRVYAEIDHEKFLGRVLYRSS